MTIFGGQLNNGHPCTLEIRRVDDRVYFQIVPSGHNPLDYPWINIGPGILPEVLDELSDYATSIAELLNKRETVRGNAPKYRRVRGAHNG